jgi:hypothetical protein
MWEKVFSQRFPVKGATKAELLALTSSISQPLSEAEIQAVNASQRNPFPKKDPLHTTWKPFDPRKWQISAKPLPASYLDFLKWSNGGAFINGRRKFDPMFSTKTIRDYLVSYCVPQYMPGHCPSLSTEAAVSTCSTCGLTPLVGNIPYYLPPLETWDTTMPFLSLTLS